MAEEIQPSAVITPLTRAEAKKLTSKISSRLDDLWELVAEAYVRQAWKALDYPSWQAYVTAEFGTERFRIPTTEKSAVMGRLRDAGMSLRAISASTGDSPATISRHLPPVSDETPEPLGTDGKRYRRQQTAEPAPGERAGDSPAENPGLRWLNQTTAHLDTAHDVRLHLTDDLLHGIPADRKLSGKDQLRRHAAWIQALVDALPA